MLAERSVRRLSIRAPDAALARRGAFLIEDALRTASLPGEGGELVLLRRLRLPPFAGTASPQQVAGQLAAACRTAVAIDGALLGDARLAAAEAVRFADALTAHLLLTRLILTRAARAAWCWPLLVSGYRPALDGAQALRAVALSLAALPEAPAALPRWLALLLTHDDGACARLLLALSPGDVAILDAACGEAVAPASDASPQAWQAALDWSLRQLGSDDQRHLWLARLARRCGSPSASRPATDALPDAGQRAAAPGVAAAIEGAAARRDADDAVAATVCGLPTGTRSETTASSTAGDTIAGSGDDRRDDGDGDGGAVARRERPRSPRRPAAIGGADSGTAATGGGPERARTDRVQPPLADAPGFTARPTSAAAISATSRTPAASRPVASPPAAGPLAPAAAALIAGGEGIARRQPTAAGGLLFLVPVLRGLGFAGWLAEDAARRDMPQRIFVLLLRRLSVDGDDPIWLLFGQALDPDVAADGEAARWLCNCRGHLRRRVGIGLCSLVCRPARLSLTPTHADVWQDLDAVDLRLRRAGLDLDPGWVPWLGRVLRFHYGRDAW
ncbi:MAG: hypothetical protein HT579_13640 [Candidatus Accumulibacter similis]|nr:MAG: hypothetical protein HT579_13640 [Candidatus Accumulibacter similis]